MTGNRESEPGSVRTPNANLVPVPRGRPDSELAAQAPAMARCVVAIKS